MSNNSILLINPEFEPSTSADCNLLIRIGLDSFSYAIINDEHNEVNAVFDEQECTDVAQKFGERLKNDHYLMLNYKSVKLAVYTPNLIAIPSELYVEEQIGNHIQYFGAKDFGNVYSQQQGNFQNIYAFASEVEDLINSRFPIAKRYHINTCLSALSSQANKEMLIDFTVGSFTIIYKQQQALVFQQTYEISNAEEFNYYLLLAISQLNIPVAETMVNLSGIVNENDERHEAIKQYFNQVNFTKLATSLNQEVLEDMPAHYYTTLLALNGCE